MEEIKKNASYLARLYADVVRNKNIEAKITGKRAVSLIRSLIKEYGRNPEDLETIFLSLQPNEKFELLNLFNDNYYNEKLQYAKTRIVPRGLSGKDPTDYQSQLRTFANNILKPNYKRIMEYEKTYFDVVINACKIFADDLHAKLWLYIDIPVNLIFKCKIENPKYHIAQDLEKELKSWNKKTAYKRKVLTAYIQVVKSTPWLKELICRELKNIEDMVKEIYNGDEDFQKREEYLKIIDEHRRLVC